MLRQNPLLVGAVGSDFAEYRQWLDSHGVDTSGVLVSETRHTARFVCTTDSDQNQIASFYPGAMSEAADIDLATLGQLDLLLISPNAPAAMVAYSKYCRDNGVAFAADPSQQLSSLDRSDIVALLDGAQILFCNAYEAALLESKTAMSADEVLAAVGTRVTTHGADGAVIQQTGQDDLRVPVVPGRQDRRPHRRRRRVPRRVPRGAVVGAGAGTRRPAGLAARDVLPGKPRPAGVHPRHGGRPGPPRGGVRRGRSGGDLGAPVSDSGVRRRHAAPARERANPLR